MRCQERRNGSWSLPMLGRTGTLPLLVSVWVLTHATVTGQQQQGVTTIQAFETATIKPQGERPPTRPPVVPNLFSRDNITLHQLLVYAYDVPAFRVVGGPSWVQSRHFEVRAKASEAPPPAQMRLMVQRLLTHRFGVRAHRETRDLPTYELVPSRSDRRPGPGLRPALMDCMPFLTGRRPMSESPTISIRGSERPRCAIGFTISRSVMTPMLNGVTIGRFADFLQRTINREVVDKTALEGLFDIELHYEDDSIPPAFRTTGTPDAPALFTALGEQLGLRLHSTHGAVEVLVIDAAAPPTEN